MPFSTIIIIKIQYCLFREKYYIFRYFGKNAYRLLKQSHENICMQRYGNDHL